MKLESIEYDQWGGCQAQTKEVGRGRGKKNTPARSYCWFRGNSVRGQTELLIVAVWNLTL